ncbi:ROK family protein [Indiicoccus explosivorum]|uniref:ROK family protein n=1 Tax=Indiicoccus explosivorum TaxID=1917864 RepID=UPI000B445E0C|nr:ROK family protein [Indiicoccus explosivorum]
MVKVAGIDIGGTKIRMAVVDETGNVFHDERIKTEIPLYPYLEKHVLRLMENHPEVEAIGIGTHGFVDPVNGRIIYATETLPGWTGTEVKKQLEQATGKRVEVENDANCAVLAEAAFGAAKGKERVVCLTIGTGLGGGILWDGKLLSGGPHGGAAEVGHMLLYPGGVTCTCGRKGCFEQYVSGTALRRRIQEAGLDIAPDELFIKAESDPAAREVVEGFVKDLAYIISTLQAALDMELVVIGGGVSESAEHWWHLLSKELDRVLLHPLEVKIAQHENDAGILGASLLVQGPAN